MDLGRMTVELLHTFELAIQDAQRAERLTADPRFLASLRRYPAATLRTFALANPKSMRDADLDRVERMVLLRKIA